MVYGSNYYGKSIWVQSNILGYLETRGFTLLGWPDGDEEILLPIWIFLDQ
jgi:hypothetical protein